MSERRALRSTFIHIRDGSETRIDHRVEFDDEFPEFVDVVVLEAMTVQRGDRLSLYWEEADDE